MARSDSGASRMTLYRLVGLPSLPAAVRDKYREVQFTPHSVRIGSRDALLCIGKTQEKEVGWAKTVTRLADAAVELTNQVPAAVLLLADPSEVPDVRGGLTGWAVTFGMGRQLLDQRYIDSGFGQRIAIRCADPTRLNSLTKVTMDERSRTERSSIPAGASLRSFGFEDIGELATRLVATGTIVGIGNPDKPVTIRGADALSLPLSTDPQTFLRNLDIIKEALALPPKSDELGFLEQLVLVKSSNKALLDRLDSQLIGAILQPDGCRLGLAWPHETIDEFGTPQKYKLVGTGQRKLRDGLPELDALLEPIRVAPDGQGLAKLDSLSVLLFENDEELASGRLPLRKWISYETGDGPDKYFLHSGRWYRMDDDYANTLRMRTREIFSRPVPVPDLPSWSLSFTDENAYNQKVAEVSGGLCLDRKLIQAETRRGMIEACDVLLRRGIFVHVKHTHSSSPASHLLAQALVSAEILSYDVTAQKNLQARIKQLGGDPDEYEVAPKHVVVVMAKEGRVLTPDDLFTFTQVNLGRQDRMLASRGVNVSIIPILKEGTSQAAHAE